MNTLRSIFGTTSFSHFGQNIYEKLSFQWFPYFGRIYFRKELCITDLQSDFQPQVVNVIIIRMRKKEIREHEMSTWALGIGRRTWIKWIMHSLRSQNWSVGNERIGTNAIAKFRRHILISVFGIIQYKHKHSHRKPL